MKRTIACAIFFVCAFTAQANDKPINDKVILRNLDRAFEIAAADLGTMTVIYENECGEKFPAWCSFYGQGKLEIRGIADTIDSPPSNITITYTPDGDPNPFLLNVGILVSICEPQMKQEERGKIIASIIQIAGKKKEGSIVEGENCDYSVTDLLGNIMVVAAKAVN